VKIWPCFICGSEFACRHREPELLEAAIRLYAIAGKSEPVPSTFSDRSRGTAGMAVSRENFGNMPAPISPTWAERRAEAKRRSVLKV
jgi:hypothetical protein